MGMYVEMVYTLLQLVNMEAHRGPYIEDSTDSSLVQGLSPLPC